jgi:hypothetical protein
MTIWPKDEVTKLVRLCSHFTTDILGSNTFSHTGMKCKWSRIFGSNNIENMNNFYSELKAEKDLALERQMSWNY